MNKLELLQAYDDLKDFIDYYIETHKIRYKAKSNAPDTYKKLRASYNTLFGLIIVYDGGDHGLFGKEYNIRFRAMHDYMHYHHNLSFKFNDERKLSKITVDKFREYNHNTVNLSIDRFENVCNLIHAEIAGQIDYYEKHGDYVTDQTQYILNHFNLNEVA